MESSQEDPTPSMDYLPHIIFSSNGFLYVKKVSSDSCTSIQCIREKNCPAHGVIVDQEITLHAQHNHSYYIDRVVAIKTKNEYNKRNSFNSKLELIKLVKVQPSTQCKVLEKSKSPTASNVYSNIAEVEEKSCVCSSTLVNTGDLPKINISVDTCRSTDSKYGTQTVKETCSLSKSTENIPTETDKAMSDVETALSTEIVVTDAEEPSYTEDILNVLETTSKQLDEASDSKSNHVKTCFPAIEIDSDESGDSNLDNLPRITCIKTERFDSPIPVKEVSEVMNDEIIDSENGSHMIDEGKLWSGNQNILGTVEDIPKALNTAGVPSAFTRVECVSSPSLSSVQGSEVELIEGSMKNSYLYLQDGYLYERNTILRNKRAYVHCNQRKKHPFCHARGVLEGSSIRLTREHNHLPDPLRVDQLKLKARCKRRAEEDATANLKTIFDEEAANFKDSSFEFKYSFFGRMMKRRKHSIPNTPKSMDDFMRTLQENEHRFCSAQSGEQFFSSFITATDFSIASFVSPAFNNILKDVQTVHVDCMFKDVPFLFKHVCSVLVSYEDYVFPVVYALMTSESEAAYTILFKFLKQQLPTLNPKEFVLEYDQKVINAVHSAYPSVECTGGFFNYALAVWREVQDKKFINYYTEDREAQLCVRMILALPLLPSMNTESGFAFVRHKIQCVQKGRLILQGILDCVQHCWLNRLGAENFSVSGRPERACLDVDAYLSRLKHKVGNASGNIFITLDKLKAFEDSEKKEFEKIVKRSSGKRKTSCVLVHGKVKEITEKLVNAKASTKDFLEEIIPFVNPPTSDALDMYTATYPIRVLPQFKPLMQVVTLDQLQDIRME